MINKIFVYGTLQRGMYNASFINDEWIDKSINATIQGDLYMVKRATFPAVINVNSSENLVYGELYEIKEEFIKDAIEICDRLEGHPHFYKREEVPVTDKNGYQHIAYAYIFIHKDEIGEKIRSGNYKEYYDYIAN